MNFTANQLLQFAVSKKPPIVVYADYYQEINRSNGLDQRLSHRQAMPVCCQYFDVKYGSNGFCIAFPALFTYSEIATMDPQQFQLLMAACQQIILKHQNSIKKYINEGRDIIFFSPTLQMQASWTFLKEIHAKSDEFDVHSLWLNQIPQLLQHANDAPNQTIGVKYQMLAKQCFKWAYQLNTWISDTLSPVAQGSAIYQMIETTKKPWNLNRNQYNQHQIQQHPAYRYLSSQNQYNQYENDYHDQNIHQQYDNDDGDNHNNQNESDDMQISDDDDNNHNNQNYNQKQTKMIVDQLITNIRQTYSNSAHADINSLNKLQRDLIQFVDQCEFTASQRGSVQPGFVNNNNDNNNNNNNNNTKNKPPANTLSTRQKRKQINFLPGKGMQINIQQPTPEEKQQYKLTPCRTPTTASKRRGRIISSPEQLKNRKKNQGPLFWNKRNQQPNKQKKLSDKMEQDDDGDEDEQKNGDNNNDNNNNDDNDDNNNDNNDNNNDDNDDNDGDQEMSTQLSDKKEEDEQKSWTTGTNLTEFNCYDRLNNWLNDRIQALMTCSKYGKHFKNIEQEWNTKASQELLNEFGRRGRDRNGGNRIVGFTKTQYREEAVQGAGHCGVIYFIPKNMSPLQCVPWCKWHEWVQDNIDYMQQCIDCEAITKQTGEKIKEECIAKDHIIQYLPHAPSKAFRSLDKPSIYTGPASRWWQNITSRYWKSPLCHFLLKMAWFRLRAIEIAQKDGLTDFQIDDYFRNNDNNNNNNDNNNGSFDDNDYNNNNNNNNNNNGSFDDNNYNNNNNTNNNHYLSDIIQMTTGTTPSSNSTMNAHGKYFQKISARTHKNETTIIGRTKLYKRYSIFFFSI